MYKLILNRTGARTGLAGILKLGIIAMLGFAAVSGLAQPANDLFASAQVLKANRGTATGSNVGATSEPGEPVCDNIGGGKTIWYQWTPTNNETIEFDTEGSSFDTVMAVYEGTSVSNLTLLAQNDDLSFPSDLTSRVDFPVVANTTYYIQIDGNEGDSGNVILNWSPTGDYSGGGFRFASSRSTCAGNPLYISSEEDSWPYANFNGTVNKPMHARVIRTGGNAGKVYVAYAVTNVMWTDIFITNYYGTNIFTTNVPMDTNGVQTGPTTFTNYFFTNLYSMSEVASAMQGTGCQGYNIYINGLTSAQTNANGQKSTIIFGTMTSNTPGCNFGVSNVVPGLITVTNITNGSSVVQLTTQTNIFCYWVTNKVAVPSATPGVDYQPYTNVLTFRDYQMAADINYTNIPNGAAYYTPFVNLTNLRNHQVVITLSNPVFDTNEAANSLAPPTIAVSNAYVTEFNLNSVNLLDTSTGILYTGVMTNQIVNFQKTWYWVSETPDNLANNTRTAVVYVERTGTNLQGCSVSYVADFNFANNTANTLNTFPLEPGSDYATPPNSSPESREGAHFNVQSGTLTWGGPTDNPYKTFTVTVNYDPTVQFNQDLILQLFNPQSCVIGQVGTANMTILFNDEPAGAIDTGHNPDNGQGSQPPFNAAPGAGTDQDTVFGIAVQPNNQSLIVGQFPTYNEHPFGNVCRVNTDGTYDANFMASPNSGANSTVNCVALQPDGKIVIGGVFTSFNGTNRFRVARLNTDGNLDLNFNPGYGANNTVLATAIQPNGQILIGGSFTFYNQTNRNFIARLNTDGSLDTNFVPGIGPNSSVNAIALQADGKIVIGGNFTSIDNTNFAYIARLNTNGTLDTTFYPGTGADAPVYSLTEQPDGKVIVAGQFQNLNLTPYNYIGRLNSDGSVDTSFYIGSGADDIVYTTALDANNNILVGGLFKSFNSSRRVGVARLYPSGLVDSTFMDTGFNQFAGTVNDYWNQVWEPKSFLRAVGLQSDGGVLIGGHFFQVGGGGARDDIHPRVNFARLIGGSTVGPNGSTLGPGNIGLTYSTYSMNMPDLFAQQNSLFVSIIRSNGYLGPASVNCVPTPVHQGPGSAIPGKDYQQNVATVTYPSSYGGPGPGNGASWMMSDDFTVNNYHPITTFLPNQTIFLNGNIGPSVTALYDSTATENLGLNIILNQPSDVLTLGGEPIPFAMALGLSSAPLTIIDNEVQAGAFGFSTQQYYVNENATNATITVVRNSGVEGQVTVQYETIPGTALPGPTNDYIAVSGTLVFSSGVSNMTFQVPIVNNTIVRPSRTLNLYLYNAGGGATITTSNALLTIINDNLTNGYVTFSNANYSALQSAPNAQISVVRLGGSYGIEQVSYSTSDGTGVAGTDYIATNGTLTWQNGDTAPKYITVPLLNSGLVSAGLTVNLTLSNALVGGVANPNALQSPNATLNIIDVNNFGSPTLSTSNYFVNENGGAVWVTVNRLGGIAQTMTVDYYTSDGTALGGSDYTPTGGTLVFNPGEISKSFYVLINDNDPQTNDQDYFYVTLTNATPNTGPGGGVTIGNPSTATVTIIANQVENNPPGGVDTTFNPSAGFNGTVDSLQLQPDGSILAGGEFTEANSIQRNHIARLNSVGQLDIKFSSGNAGANGTVRAMAVQTDGQIMVGGQFTKFNGVNQNYITRLNYDGTLDSTFNIAGQGADNPVYAIAETFDNDTTNSEDRKILIGGSFASIDGIPYRSIAELNEDGTVDNSFNAVGANGTVYAIAVYSTNDALNGSKILIGGDFTVLNGTNVNHIARLNADGTLDTSFNNSQFMTGPSDSVRAIAIQVDGKVVIGGLFTNVNGVAQNYISRVNADGSVDTNFNIGVGADNAVTALALQQDNKILVGGAFTHCNGVTRNRLTRLNTDGTPDATINFGTGANNFVDAIVVQPDTKIVIGGAFTQYGGANTPYIARIFGGSVVGEGTVTFTAPLYQVNERGTNIVIPVQRLGGTGDNGPGSTYNGPIYVNFSTLPHTENDGLASATDGVDYNGITNLTLTFQPGETFQYVTIPVLNDPTNMGELYADLALTPPGNPATDAQVGPQPTAELGIIGANSTVSFSSAYYSVNKNNNSGMAAITIQRNESAYGPASVVFYTLTNGTATAGLDYTAVTNVVEFSDGQSNAIVEVPIINNGLPEGNLTVIMGLEDPTNTVLDTSLPTMAQLTIVDNSQSPGQFTFSTNAYFVPETAGTALITIVRTNGGVGTVSVNFSATSSGGPSSATNGVDFVSTNGSLTFLDGVQSQTFQVPVINDTNLSGNVIVNLTLSAPTGGTTLLSSNATLTILNENNDVSFAQAGYFVDEKSGSLQIGVLRFGNTNNPLQVNYSTTNGTAFAGTNYAATSGTLTFLAGQTEQFFTVPIIYDSAITGDLIFFINLSKPNGSPAQIIGNVSVPVTVLDDDTGFMLASTTNSIVKGNTNALITVVRVGSTAGSASVNFATTGGTAVANGEYIPTNGVLNFLSGDVSNSFSIPILNDGQIDGDQTVNYAISVNPTNNNGAELLLPTNGVLTIIDNESGFNFSSSTYSVMENGVFANITVLRSGFTNDSVSVNYLASNGTATNGLQYTSVSGTLVFATNQTSTNFQVPIIDNNVTGGSETVLLQLSSPSPSATLLSPSAAVLTIFNNDGSLIIPAGSAILSPASTVITPGASVTALLSLRNAGGADATSVTATLLNTNGVTPTSGQQSYGNLLDNGPSTYRQFTFNASGTNGGLITAVLALQYYSTKGLTNSTASFTFQLGSATNYFYNTNFINILDATSNGPTAASPYPSSINVSSLLGVISNVTVTVSNFGHGFESDVSMLLVGPGGQKDLLMEHDGGPLTVTNRTFSFDSHSATAIGTNAPVNGATYGLFPSITSTPFPTSTNGVTPPPLPYHTNLLQDYTNTNPNGIWSLYVDDTKRLDTGSINNGWRLGIATIAVNAANNDLVLGISGPGSVIVNSNLTYTICVTNAGPWQATGITITNVLPPGVSLVSISGATYTNASGVVLMSVPSLANNGTATIYETVTASQIGYITNAVSVGDAQIEDNTANNVASLVTSVVYPTADVGITVSVSPYPVLLGNQVTFYVNVTNLGPGTATGVYVTNQLPAGFTLVSDNAVGGFTNVNGFITSAVSDMGNGGDCNFTIVATAGSAGTSTVGFGAWSLNVPDQLKGNNTAFVKVVSDNVPLGAQLSGKNLNFSWSVTGTNTYRLQSTTNLSSGIWINVTNTVSQQNGENTVTVPVAGGTKFFRLIHP